MGPALSLRRVSPWRGGRNRGGLTGLQRRTGDGGGGRGRGAAYAAAAGRRADRAVARRAEPRRADGTAGAQEPRSRAGAARGRPEHPRRDARRGPSSPSGACAAAAVAKSATRALHSDYPGTGDRGDGRRPRGGTAAEEPMPTQIVLPACLMDAYRLIFPDLDWDRITFYEGIPFPLGASNAIAVPKLFATEIYLKEGKYDPCAKSTFVRIAHELVHAMQYQTAATAWVARLQYLTCFFGHGIGHKYDNCYEREAKDLADWLRDRDGAPCDCAASGSATQLFSTAIGPLEAAGYLGRLRADLAGTASGRVSRESRCSLDDCFGGGVFGVARGLLSLGVATVIAVAGTFFFEGPVSRWATMVAAAGGLLSGAAVGLGFGGLSAGGGIIGAIVGAIVGSIVGALVLGLVGAILDWIGGLFGGGPSGGSLNVMFSSDQGRTFGEKVTASAARSREQPALAFRAGPDQLFVGWTGTDDRLNVLVAPDKTKATTEWSDPCGLALATGGGQVFLAWKGKDNSHPNCLSSFNGVDFGAKFTSGGDGPRESTPSVAFGNGMIYVAWVGPDNHIRLIQLRPTDPLTEVPLPLALHKLGYTTGHKGTPALAFGDGHLYLAWSRLEPAHFLHVLRLKVSPDGTIPPQPMNARTLGDWTNDTTGPALAFSARHRRLYLAFTGADDTIWVISSADGGQTFPDRAHLGNGSEKSRHDTGPAIAVHGTGAVAVSWVGTDGG
jgi:hypothetical protein